MLEDVGFVVYKKHVVAQFLTKIKVDRKDLFWYRSSAKIIVTLTHNYGLDPPTIVKLQIVLLCR